MKPQLTSNETATGRVLKPLSKPSSANYVQDFACYWGPALVWLVTIAVFSSSEFSAAHTGSILTQILKFLHVKLTWQQFASLHFLIRKSAHFTAYAILSGLFFRAWRGVSQGWRWIWLILALAVCIITSSADEIHQLFTPGRTGAGSDVLLDISGALFMQLILIVVIASKRRSNSLAV
jgi:VanZ family protein